MASKAALHKFLSQHPWLFTLKQRFDLLRTGPFRRDPATTSWSEAGEDDILCKHLQDLLSTGFYVDVGANQPTKRSNTFRLYRMGMRGITIEPNPQLSELHARYRPEDIQLCAGSGERDGVAPFYRIAAHGLSTFSSERRDALLADGHHQLSQSLIPLLTLSTVLRDCKLPGRPHFALLSVDAEAMDEIVLRSNNWTEHKPRLIVFEDNDDTASASNFLSSMGYEPLATCGANRIMQLRA